MKKIITIITILAIALVLCVLPVFAAQTEERSKTVGEVVTVYDITNGDSLHEGVGKPTVEINLEKGSNADTVVVTYTAAELKIVPKDQDSLNRGIDAAWLGIRLTPNAEGTYNNFSCSLATKADIEDNDGKSVDYYVAVTPEKLEEAVKNGKDLVYTEKFVWLTDAQADETDAPVTYLTVIVKADQMKIFDKEDNEEKWNEESYNNAVAAREAAKNAENEKAEKDTTPKTGVVNYLPVLGLVAVVTFAGAVVLKRN